MVPNDCPFDKKLDIWGNRVPENVQEATTYINDTLELCWASARQVFGDKANPEHALQIYDRIILRIKNEARSNSVNEN